jgi:hypothetical protein
MNLTSSSFSLVEQLQQLSSVELASLEVVFFSFYQFHFQNLSLKN